MLLDFDRCIAYMAIVFVVTSQIPIDRPAPPFHTLKTFYSFPDGKPARSGYATTVSFFTIYQIFDIDVDL